MPTSQITAIVAPPPTANGDLHVGHLSGPYLGADVARRYLTIRGEKVVSAISLDVNQSYVVTTAERLDCDAYILAKESFADVSETLSDAEICFNLIGYPSNEYSKYVSDWFLELHTANVFNFRELQVPFDEKRDRFMFEAYASGYCPNCLAAAKANICETCGHPNETKELLDLHPTGGDQSDSITSRKLNAWIIDLESYRLQLNEILQNLKVTLRPRLRQLIDEIFSKRLPEFPVTFPSDWGISAPFENADGYVLNVWAEMVPGHYWWLKQANPNIDLFKAQTKYIQYLGFDNSFFYTIAHLALAIAADENNMDALMPSAFITNEFLLLENYKFSTSQDHLIWGRDLLSQSSADDVRFYLAWTNPQLQESNFTIEDFQSVTKREFRTKLEELCCLLVNNIGKNTEYETVTKLYAQRLSTQFEKAYEIDTQDLRLAARVIATGLHLLLEKAREGQNRFQLAPLLEVFAAGSSPLIPETADRIWALAGNDGPIRWNTNQD